MNKKLIIIAVVLVVLIIGICVSIFLKKLEESSKELELTYEINAGIPFKWEYEIEDKDIVEFVGTKVIRDDNKGGKVGGSIYTNYIFRGKKEGTTTITFKMVSITDDNYDGTIEKNTVKVDKDLNISLVLVPKED